MSIFVTVGSTRFDSLINEVLNNLDQIGKLGFKRLTIQAGKSNYKEEILQSHRGRKRKLDIDIYRFKNSIIDDINEADLIVGHAGAGTCLEVLRLNKKLLVVVNESLMDNHQSELANQLSNENYLLQTDVKNFSENLVRIMDCKFEKFPSKESSIFEKIFNEALDKIK